MSEKKRYSIGDMSRICNISRKALRYYDKIGLITSHRQDYNNYRYYTSDSLLAVPVIKFYKQMGFTLEEMHEFVESDAPNIYSAMQKSFLAKLEALRKEQEELRHRYRSVKDWYDLVLEAEMVIETGIREVSVKFVEPAWLLYQEQQYENDNKASIINIRWTNYVESLHNAISGPVILHFASHEDRVRERPQAVTIMQKTLRPCSREAMFHFGGHMMATCYHIGPHAAIGDSYRKIRAWARRNEYELGPDCFERYVSDYWTSRNESQFVTEIMIRIARRDNAPRSLGGDRGFGENGSNIPHIQGTQSIPGIPGIPDLPDDLETPYASYADGPNGPDGMGGLFHHIPTSPDKPE